MWKNVVNNNNGNIDVSHSQAVKYSIWDLSGPLETILLPYVFYIVITLCKAISKCRIKLASHLNTVWDDSDNFCGRSIWNSRRTIVGTNYNIHIHRIYICILCIYIINRQYKSWWWGLMDDGWQSQKSKVISYN